MLVAAALCAASAGAWANTDTLVGWRDLTYKLESLDVQGMPVPEIQTISLYAISGPAYYEPFRVPVTPDYRFPESFYGFYSVDVGCFSRCYSAAQRNDKIWSFHLSANTRLTLDGFFFAASSGPSDVTTKFGQVFHSDGYAHVGFGGFSNAGGFGGSAGFGFGESGRLDVPFHGVFESGEDTSTIYTVQLNGISQSFWREVPPVPEPGTWALMLAGCAALGIVSRRRRR